MKIETIEKKINIHVIEPFKQLNITEIDKITEQQRNYALLPSSDISKEDSKLQKFCNQIWTKEVQQKWKKFQESPFRFPDKILETIRTIDPTAHVSIHGEEITWHDGNPKKITDEQIQEKIKELEQQEKVEEVKQEAQKRLLSSDYWALQDTDDMTPDEQEYRKELRTIIRNAEKENLTLETVVWPQIKAGMRSISIY